MLRRVILYGRVGIELRYCDHCNEEAFCVDNILQCCGNKIKVANEDFIEGESRDSVNFKRETEGSYKRKKVTGKVREKILESQNWKCAYCQVDLHTTEIHFDHFIPYSYIPDNRIGNLIASCSDCNFSKSNRMFNNIGEASENVKEKSIRKKALRKLQGRVFPSEEMA